MSWADKNVRGRPPRPCRRCMSLRLGGGREVRGCRVGRVRKRRRKNHGTRFLAIARLDDVDVALGTHDTFEDAGASGKTLSWAPVSR
jgi:hypothetical protein